jgi:hypothetical protein
MRMSSSPANADGERVSERNLSEYGLLNGTSEISSRRLPWDSSRMLNASTFARRKIAALDDLAELVGSVGLRKLALEIKVAPSWLSEHPLADDTTNAHEPQPVQPFNLDRMRQTMTRRRS